jgi:uncharacterized membrane protein
LTLRRLLLARGLLVVVVSILAVVAFASDEEIFGALLAGLAITNLILITIFVARQRRAAPPAP